MKESKKQKKKEEINKDEFSYGWTGSSSGKNVHSVTRGGARKDKLTSRRITVRDLVNGEEMYKEVTPGNYSKKEMQKLTYDTIDEMIVSLYNKRK